MPSKVFEQGPYRASMLTIDSFHPTYHHPIICVQAAREPRAAGRAGGVSSGLSALCLLFQHLKVVKKKEKRPRRYLGP